MLEELRSRIAQIVPVHFPAEVSSSRVRRILEGTFQDNAVFCKADETWVVVDAGTPAERVLQEARSDPFRGIRLHSMEVNRGKTGAIRAALEWALSESRAEFFVTRDCDGDNRIEDLPRLVLLAEAIHFGGFSGPRSVFGCRPSLSKPMNWERLQWENVTNQVVFDLTAHLLARQERTLEKNFWNQPVLDLQSGYRLYDREAARLAFESLASLPDDREVYLLACEVSPFIEISLAGGRIGQIYRSTQIDQPVSSYARMDFARYYGKLLAYYADRYGITRLLARQFFDNALVESEAINSPLRERMLQSRRLIDPSAPELLRPPLL